MIQVGTENGALSRNEFQEQCLIVVKGYRRVCREIAAQLQSTGRPMRDQTLFFYMEQIRIFAGERRGGKQAALRGNFPYTACTGPFKNTIYELDHEAFNRTMMLVEMYAVED